MVGTGKRLTVISLPLFEPVNAGVLLITLILYPLAAGVLEGMVALIVPAALVPVSVPMFVGVVKLPVPSLN